MNTIPDETVYEYRASKDKLNAPIIARALEGHFEKDCVLTEYGQIEFMIYRPESADENVLLPAVFSFHGGGFVLGYYETDGPYCQKLANLSGCALINVDYPLAPEYKFPKPPLACYEAIQKILEKSDLYHLDSDSVIVMGHSAGGCIAADICLLNKKEKKLALQGQILDYAPLKQSVSENDRKALEPSKAIAPSRMLQYISWYFNDLKDLEDPLASPLLADLSDLPDALVIGAEYDSLCQEEKEFVKKASSQGTNAEFVFYPGVCHGFTHEHLKEYSPKQAEDAWKRMADFIKIHTHPDSKN